MIIYDTLSIILHLVIFNIVLTRAQPLPIFKARKAGLLYRHRKIPKLACEPTIVDEVCPFQLNLSNQAKPSNIDLLQQDMGVSKNNGTPKPSILIGVSIINHPFWGTPIFGNTHIPLPETNVGKMLVGRRLPFLLGPEAAKDPSILMQRHEFVIGFILKNLKRNTCI